MDGVPQQESSNDIPNPPASPEWTRVFSAELDGSLGRTSQNVHHDDEEPSPVSLRWSVSFSPSGSKTMGSGGWTMPYEDNDLGVLESLNMRRLSFRQMGSGIEEAAVDTEESSVADRSEATEGAAIPATYSIDNSREGDAVDASADTVRTQRGDVTGSLSTPCDDVSYQAAGETTTDVSSQNDLPVSPPICYLALVNQEVFDEIIMYLVPDIDSVPLNHTWRHGKGKEAVNDLIALMQSGRWLRDAVMGCYRVWGGIVPAAVTPTDWIKIVSRTGDAPIRLSYRDGIDTALLDSQLYRASAIYAGYECSRDDFTSLLDRNSCLPALQVLYLRPWHHGLPSGHLPSASHELSAPRARICETSFPIILGDAPNLQRLGCSNYNEAQLMSLLERPRPSLIRLDVSEIRSDRAIDLTALLNRLNPTSLEFLRIRCGPAVSGPLPKASAGYQVHLPLLKTLDVGGPFWLNAPSVRFARIFNAGPREILSIMDGLPSVKQLHLRWRPGQSADIHPPLPRVLPALKSLHIAGVTSEDTTLFLRHISAKSLQALQMFCDMREQAKFSTLPTIRHETANALEVFGEDAEQLRQSLGRIQMRLCDGGYQALGDRLDDVLMPGLEELGETIAEPPDTIEAMRIAATEIVAALSLEETRGPPPHADILLEGVVTAALAVVGLSLPHSGSDDMLLYEDDIGVQCHARARGQTCHIRLTMLPAGDKFRTGLHLQPSDSPAFCFARFLFGLGPLRPRRMRIKGDILRILPDQYGEDELNEIREALQRYVSVEELSVDFSPHIAQNPTLTLLCDFAVFPSLKKLTIHVRQYYSCCRSVWVALEEMVISRERGGRRLHHFVVEGRVRAKEPYTKRVRSAVDILDLKIDHERLQGVYCPICA